MTRNHEEAGKKAGHKDCSRRQFLKVGGAAAAAGTGLKFGFHAAMAASAQRKKIRIVHGSNSKYDQNVIIRERCVRFQRR